MPIASWLRSESRRAMAATLLLLLLIAPRLGASQTPEDFNVRSWTHRDGLPSARVYAITQDADGYLWIGTSAGLARFDGVRFVHWEDIGGTTGGVLGLMRDADSSIWAAFGDGRIARFKGPKLAIYDHRDGLGSGFMKTFAQDRGGQVWAGGRGGLFKFTADRWEHQGRASGLPDGPNYGLLTDRTGVLWVMTPAGVYRRNVQGLFEASPPPPLIAASEQLAKVSVPGIADGATPTQLTATGNALNPLTALEDGEGTFWIATLGQGLWRVRADGSQWPFGPITDSTGLSSNVIRALFEDREGHIWVGTSSGLDQISRRRIAPVGNLGFANSIQSSADGSVWVGSDQGLIRIRGNTRHTYTPRDGLPRAMIRTLFSDRSGVVWVATDQGVVKFEHDRFVELRIPRGRHFYRISAITVDSKEGVWLCDQFQGIFRLRDGVLTSIDTSPEISRRTAYTAITDSHDRVWIGFSDAYVGILAQEGHFSLLGPTGLLGNITSIMEGRDGSIWIGGGDGVSRFTDGRFTTATSRRNGFPAASVTSIVEDAQQTLWIGTGLGIVRIEKVEFDRVAADPSHRIHYKLYDDSDGLKSMPIRVADRAAVRAHDGRLWFLTDRGAAVLDPKDFTTSPMAPRVRIEGIRTNAGGFVAQSGVELPLRSSRVEIDYTALSFAAPASVRFKYRLDGFDTDWVDAGTLRQAIYTNLAPRAYTFRVRASDKEGISEAADTTFAFTVQPAFFQTSWFYAVCVLAAVAGAAGAWRLRIAAVNRRFALVLAERMRISREIHDTLLQSLVAVALETGTIAEEAPTSVRTALMRLRREVEEQIRETRQSIRDLRSAALKRDDLVSALRHVGERICRQESIRFSLTVHGEPRECTPTLEEQVLRIGQEALTNAGRHARAKEIRLALAFNPDCVQLRVIDDGIGFNSDHVTDDARAHFGLLSMRERAEHAGGQLILTTAPGSGTEVMVTIPTQGSPAYA